MDSFRPVDNLGQRLWSLHAPDIEVWAGFRSRETMTNSLLVVLAKPVSCGIKLQMGLRPSPNGVHST